MNATTPMEERLLQSLGTLRPGTRGTIVHFDILAEDGSHSDLADRLREIGFAENLEVEVLHQSPFGRDPIAVRVGKMTIALRRKEANIVKVQVA